jgi:hypothetical protein
MRIESTEFTGEDLDRFLDDLVERERDLLVERLERVSARVGELAPRVPDEPASGSEAWNAREVLAHIAVLSKFYGVVGYRIGSGEMSELDLRGNVSQRDVQGERLAQLPPSQLLAMAQADHDRTLDWLRGATSAQLRRRCDMGEGMSMTAEDVLRLALCAHLEQHVEQLERAL